jgi:ribonucrease Y
MIFTTINLIFLFLGFSFAGIILYFLKKKILLKKEYSLLEDSNKKAQKILEEAQKEAQNLKRDHILKAKEEIIESRAKAQKDFQIRERKITDLEKNTKEKEIKVFEELESQLKNKSILETQIKQYEKKLQILKISQEKCNKTHKEQVELLEKIANYSALDAKETLIKSLKEEAKLNARIHIQQIIEESQLSAKAEARKIIIQTIQRLGTEEAIENATSVFHIESNNLKGKIIGKEGRNIKALEQATGVEIIVDDTPEAVLLSCFDPIRRELAKLALQKLILDGRIHPARIEEVVAKSQKELEEEIISTGKKTLIELGIYNIHPNLIKKIGRMKYRSSYGQNLLSHSKEVSRLSGMLASECGLNPKLAKRAGLLHDIGKVSEGESEFSHAIIAMQLAEKYGEIPEICNAIGAHHDEIEMNHLISPIIQVADAISGSRPGVKRNTFESYIKRLKNLETIALSFEGVYKAFAIQAGRELRVMVESESVDDKKAFQISYEISKKIQSEMTYPGQIKVTVIRETRAIHLAK